MGGRPAVRARSAQDWLDYLDRLEPGLRSRVVEAMPEASRRIILEAPKTEWIELEHDRYVPWATIEVMGEDAAVAGWRSFLKSHVEAPLFKTLVDSMVRLFGLTPSTFAKLLPRAWNQSYRDCCEVKVMDAGDSHAHVAFLNVAPGIMEWDPYPISWRGVLLGAYEISGFEGEVEMSVNRELSRIDAHWNW